MPAPDFDHVGADTIHRIAPSPPSTDRAIVTQQDISRRCRRPVRYRASLEENRDRLVTHIFKCPAGECLWAVVVKALVHCLPCQPEGAGARALRLWKRDRIRIGLQVLGKGLTRDRQQSSDKHHPSYRTQSGQYRQTQTGNRVRDRDDIVTRFTSRIVDGSVQGRRSDSRPLQSARRVIVDRQVWRRRVVAVPSQLILDGRPAGGAVHPTVQQNKHRHPSSALLCSSTVAMRKVNESTDPACLPLQGGRTGRIP